MEIKRVLFVTGTRADFGKLKPLISMVQKDKRFDCSVFVTGMHILKKYGSTIHEVYSAKIKNVFPFINQIGNEDSKMDIILANTVTGLSHYIHEFPQDLIVVHGDRTETLAGAIVGMSNDIPVAHIEGGEISGTVDELIRHAVTKLSRMHFVANKEAKKRLIQLGECEGSIFVIGSPDIDLMLSNKLPMLEEVKKRYEIPFDRYAIFLYHPVTTELDKLKENIEVVLNALEDSGLNYVLLYPNNDIGSNIILQAYEGLKGNSRFKIYPSMRFSYFLTLLKNSITIVGNSSSGIREAPVYGVPTVNIGTRQLNRYNYKSIINVKENKQEILKALQNLPKDVKPSLHFGKGNSAVLFMQVLRRKGFWTRDKQKQFLDIEVNAK